MHTILDVTFVMLVFSGKSLFPYYDQSFVDYPQMYLVVIPISLFIVPKGAAVNQSAEAFWFVYPCTTLFCL